MRKKKRFKVTKSDIYSGLFLNSSIFKGKYLYELQRGINGSASLLCSFAAFFGHYSTNWDESESAQGCCGIYQ